MKALGYDADQLEVLLLQMVSLFRDGKPVKMSKRTGQAITLNELIEEVGADAARYFFIMDTLYMTWLTAAIVLIITFSATRGRSLVPSGIQNAVEMVVEALLDQFKETLGPK